MKSKLDDFINKYKNRIVDFDGRFGGQCIDLFRQYAKEVWGVREHTGTVRGAKDLVENFHLMKKQVKYFDLIKDSQKMKSGDVVVFGRSKNNKFGHVAIVVEPIFSKNKIISVKVFEQDGLEQGDVNLGSRRGAKFGVWKVENVIGLLRKKE